MSRQRPRRYAACQRVARLCRPPSSRCSALVRLGSVSTIRRENLRLTLAIYALAALPFFAGGLAVTLAISPWRPGSTPCSPRTRRRGRRMPGPDPAPRSPRCPGRRARGGRAVGAAASLFAPAAPRAKIAGRHRPSSSRCRSQASSQGSPPPTSPIRRAITTTRSSSRVELVLEHRRGPADARRLVAERHGYDGPRPDTRYMESIGRIDTDPARWKPDSSQCAGTCVTSSRRSLITWPRLGIRDLGLGIRQSPARSAIHLS